jgi:hypothetical protein
MDARGAGGSSLLNPQSKSCVLKKKQQKSFARSAYVADFGSGWVSARAKVFWFFFSKKNILP